MAVRFAVRRVLGLLLIGGGTALTLWHFDMSPIDRLVAHKWRRQIDAANDREAVAEVRRIASLGLAGLPELAALLGSERWCVAEAARQALDQEMRRWGDLAPAERRRRQLSLARAIAGEVEQLGPDARCLASDVALRILAATPATDAAEAEIVALCDQVLRASAAQRRERLLARRPTAEIESGRRRSDEFEANRAPRLAKLPGGDLMPEGLAATAGTPDISAEEHESPPPLRQELAANEPARLPAEAQGEVDAADDSEQSLEDSEALLHRRASVAADATEEAAAAEVDAELRWMFALRSSDPNRRQKAEQALRALGFEALQLELARQLTDPNPTIRRELAESLPSMPGIDARAWLVWLSRDQNADVRLSAMSVMATMGDLSVMRHIEQMARRDADPRVQRQGERLLKVLEADSRSSGGGARPLTR